MNPSSSGPDYTTDPGYFGKRVLFYTNRFPVHTKHRIRPPQAQPSLAQLYMIPGFWVEFQTSKRLSQKISGISGEKSTNSRILEQFEHSPDILAIFHGKNVNKTFLLYSYRQEGSVCLNATLQCLEHCLLSTTNQRLIIRVVYVTTYQRLLTKRPKFFEKILEILESLWRILDISKRILELYSRNSGKNFRSYFENYLAKPSPP